MLFESRCKYSTLKMLILFFIPLIILKATDVPQIKKISLPLLFTKNNGQWHRDILYSSQTSRGTITFGKKGYVISSIESQLQSWNKPELQSAPQETYPAYSKSDMLTNNLSISFLHPSSRIKIFSTDIVAAKKYFYKSGSKHENVPSFSSIEYQNVWDDIYVKLYSSGKKLKQLFIIKPHSDFSKINLAVNGNNNISLSDTKSELIFHDVNNTSIKINRAYQIIGSDTILLSASGKLSSKKVLGFSVDKVNRSKHLFIETEFSTYFGGSGTEFVASIKVDDDGNIYLTGLTNSVDFPLKNPVMNWSGGNLDAFVSKFSCDGKTLLFSTYLGGSGEDYSHDLTIGLGNSAYVVGQTTSSDFPTTINAFKGMYDSISKPLSLNGFLCKINNGGQLIFSSYIGGAIGAYLMSATSDSKGNIWCGGVVGGSNWTGTLHFITSNSIQKQPNYNFETFYLKLTPSCDSILYATYFGRGGEEWPCSISVDSKDNLFALGTTSSYDLPVKNAFQQSYGGGRDNFILKLNSKGDSIIFLSYIGGRMDENASRLSVDQIDNVYVTGPTQSVDFPSSHYLQNIIPWSGQMIFLMKINSEGKLIFSTLYGGTSYHHYMETSYGIAIDRCENIYMYGRTIDQNFPLKDPLQVLDPNKIPFPYHGLGFMTVIDSSGRNFLSSSYWGIIGSSGPSYWFPKSSYMDRNGYFYCAFNAAESLLVHNAYQPHVNGPSDAFISRLHFPFCNQSYVGCDVQTIDSVRIEKLHGGIFPERFVINVPLRNIDAVKTAESIEGEITLPLGLILDPPTQTLRQKLSVSKLKPGEQASFTWFVRIDTPFIQDTLLEIKFNGWYSDAQTNTMCTMLFTNCSKNISIKYFTEVVQLACTLNSTDSLHIDNESNTYNPDPFTIQYSLHNIDNKIAKIQYVKLLLPSGFETVPKGDTIRAIPFLAIGDTKTFTWTIHPRGTRWIEDARFRVVAIDTNGFIQSSCEIIIIFPPVKQEMICSSSSPDTIKYDGQSGSYVPSKFTALFRLENRIDTVQENVTGEIDLSHAQHLVLDSNEIKRKRYAFFGANKIENFNWLVHVIGIQTTTVTDTLTMHYRTAFDTTWRSCEMYVVIEKANISALLSCSINVADTIKAGSDTLINNPFTITFNTKNIGIVPAQLQTVTLQPFNDPRIYSLDVAAQHVVPLQVGDSVSASWRVQLKSSRFYREHLIRIVVTDTSGAVVIACEKKIVVEPLDGMACRLTCIDTIKYDESTHSYKPDPVGVTLRLTNKLDTILVNIDAMIDLSYAEHLALSKNEIPIKSLFTIGEKLSDSLKWNLTLKSNAEQNDVDTIVMKYRLSPNEQWRECNFFIVIEAEKKFARSSCASTGQDSIGYDQGWEIFLPNPILVRYTLTNTGTRLLTSCSAAIILPKEFSLAMNTDSIQTYSTLQPNQSQSKEWLLVVLVKDPINALTNIRWKWNCNELMSDTSCSHQIILTTSTKDGLVLTPWLLYFRAERNGALPSSQQINLWTSNKTIIPWQASSTLSWLNYQPQNGNNAEQIDVRPNTTALPLGIHTGSLRFTPNTPYKSVDVQIEYEIYTSTHISNLKSYITISLEQNYPNPFSVNSDQSTVISFVIEKESYVVMKVFNVFGREVATLVDEEVEAGKHAVNVSSAIFKNLNAGIYFYTLSANGKTVMKKMAVVR